MTKEVDIGTKVIHRSQTSLAQFVQHVVKAVCTRLSSFIQMWCLCGAFGLFQTLRSAGEGYAHFLPLLLLLLLVSLPDITVLVDWRKTPVYLLTLPVSIFISVSVSVFLFLGLSLSVCLSGSACLSLSLPLSLCFCFLRSEGMCAASV